MGELKRSIVLAGIKHCGKSTLGALLARRSGAEFLDTDRMLEALNRSGNQDPEKLLRHVKEDIDGFVGTAPQFDDITMLAIRRRVYDEEPVVAYIVMDSLQELAQYVRVSYRTAVSEIETILKEWAAGFGGLLREYEREKYLLVFTRAALDECINNKFRILETVSSTASSGSES